MILSEYEAKREELEKQMQEVCDRGAQALMELSVRHQMDHKKLSSQMGALKKKRGELNSQYQTDKNFLRRKYNDEKRKITERIHLLRVEYLTVHGVADTSVYKATLPSGGDVQHKEGGGA